MNAFDTDRHERGTLERAGYEIVRPAKFEDSFLFLIAQVTAVWTPNVNSISASIPNPAGGSVRKTITLDLKWPGTFGTSAGNIPYCGLTSNCTVLYFRYPRSFSQSNYGLAMGWPELPPSPGSNGTYQVLEINPTNTAEWNDVKARA